MSRLELRELAEDDLDGAGELLAARHREHRRAEPLLSERFEDAAAAGAEVAELLAQEHASGAAALREGRLVGFLLGTRKDERWWGANAWVEAAGYAVAEPEIVRDLYAFAAQRWVGEGRTRHYALVPALGEQVEPWFRLSFGAQHAHGIREVESREWPPDTRRARPEDVEELAALTPLISDLQARAPVFSGLDREDDPDELRASLLADVVDDRLGELVFERDGRVVAQFELAPVELGSAHRGLAQPDRAALLGWAASLPEVRGTGAGLALMDAALAWAHERDYASMVTDWRETNLLSSRFWPARGFRRSFVRLYRSIP